MLAGMIWLSSYKKTYKQKDNIDDLYIIFIIRIQYLTEMHNVDPHINVVLASLTEIRKGIKNRDNRIYKKYNIVGYLVLMRCYHNDSITQQTLSTINEILVKEGIVNRM